jgi:hypothetical protein
MKPELVDLIDRPIAYRRRRDWSVRLFERAATPQDGLLRAVDEAWTATRNGRWCGIHLLRRRARPFEPASYSCRSARSGSARTVLSVGASAATAPATTRTRAPIAYATGSSARK